MHTRVTKVSKRVTNPKYKESKGGLSMQDSSLKRFGISMEGSLLRSLIILVKLKGYENRSEAVRDLVREAIVQQSWEDDERIIAGSILIFYDHHQRIYLKR